MEDADTFTALVHDFEVDHYSHVILGRQKPGRTMWNKDRKDEGAFAERFRDLYASSSRDITYSLIVVACLIFAVVFAVFAVIQDWRCILIMLGSVTVIMILTAWWWADVYQRIRSSRWYLIISFFSLQMLFLIPLGFDPSLIMFNMLAVFLLLLGTLNGTRRPVSLRGQLCYALLALETAAKQGIGLDIKRLPEHLSATLSSLNALLLHYFGMVIENRDEIEAVFNKRLLLEKQDYLGQLRFFEQPALLHFFAARTHFLTGLSPVEMRAKPKNLRRGLQVEEAAEQQDVVAHIDTLIKQLEGLTTEFRIQRVTLRDRLDDQIGKVVAVISLLTSVVLGVLEFIDYTGWPFTLP